MESSIPGHHTDLGRPAFVAMVKSTELWDLNYSL